jgi:UPF0755 protein
MRILKGVALILFCFSIFVISSYREFYTVVSEKETGHWIEVNEDDYFSDVSIQLSELNYIRSEGLFKIYANLRGLDTQIKAGRFYLDANLTPVGALFALVDPDLSETSITIPEGFNKFDIDELLTDLDLIDSGEYITWSDVENAEGYIFPDTYFVYSKQFEVADFGALAMNTFDEKVVDLMPEIEASSYSLNEIVIMASIIEKELKTEEDLEIVAGIFWKRLENNWPLQSDITVIYDQDDRDITYKDLNDDSSYNTYTRLGLPIGPISNPGLASIEAALNPVESFYWYFLTTSDDVIYAETNEEHEANKRRYL